MPGLRDFRFFGGNMVGFSVSSAQLLIGEKEKAAGEKRAVGETATGCGAGAGPVPLLPPPRSPAAALMLGFVGHFGLVLSRRAQCEGGSSISWAGGAAVLQMVNAAGGVTCLPARACRRERTAMSASNPAFCCFRGGNGNIVIDS